MSATREPIAVLLMRGGDTANVNTPVWGVIPHRMSVDEGWVVKIDRTLDQRGIRGSVNSL